MPINDAHDNALPTGAPPLSGKTALITGVSRRRGIGFAVARELAELGANIFIQHFRPHDLEQPWGGDDPGEVHAELRAALTSSARFGEIEADLSVETAAVEVIDAANALTGSLDILVCNHAKSGDDGSILDMTSGRLDAFWDVNTRSTLLLTAEFARATERRTGEDGGRSAQGSLLRLGDRFTDRGGRREPFVEPAGKVFWMTSGQIHTPMRGEVAYAASKAALAGVTATVAAELLELGVLLNTINPGPVNTGYLDAETTDRSLAALEQHLATTPFGRYGRPSDPASLIGWLASERGSWVVGQVLTSDGGFSLA